MGMHRITLRPSLFCLLAEGFFRTFEGCDGTPDWGGYGFADAEDWQFAADVFNDTPIYDLHHLVSINVTEAELKAIIAGWQFDWENCDDDVANFVSDAQVTEINDALAKA